MLLEGSGRSRRDNSWLGSVRRLGWPWVEACLHLGMAVRFMVTVIRHSGLSLLRPELIIRQLYIAGVKTLVIILVAGLFIGFVLGLQFYVLLDRYGQVELVGAGVALTLFRELGPVSAGLLFVGCACTAMTASIGLKKSTEQLAAMEMMAVDPISRELCPRLWAGVIALPLLTIYFDIIGVAGAYLIAVPQIGIDEGVFWSLMQERVLFYDDFVLGTLKSVVFGFVAVFIAIYEGYFCVPTAEGVASATTRTVIKGSLAVLGFNFVLTAFMI
ncbi:MAG: lipid asymmetry maintenance ABC transporter permease subunit MlaE [Betaproteobacteria bacterium]|nr:lipid asymmetry maintenance ABC transporter permease subunit MlaE [Betaproteobacteria bacterium]